MKHELHQVTSFSIVGPYVLRLVFEDGTSQTIDFRPVLKGEMFSPLRELALFNRARLDPECHTVVWPNGADFDPATLHDWPECSADFIAMARKWAEPGHPLLAVAEGDRGYVTKRPKRLSKVGKKAGNRA